MEKDKILEYLKNSDLASLEEPLKILADKIYSYKKKNNYSVPLNIFPHCLAIGGISSVVELVIECFENGKFKGYLLKERNSNESAWENLYHLPGTLVILNDTPKKMFERINKEVWGSNSSKYLEEPKYFGSEIHNEKRRKVVRMSRLYISKIDYKDIKKLNGNWKIFKGDEKEIVEHHRDVIKWKENPGKEDFVYLPESD